MTTDPHLQIATFVCMCTLAEAVVMADSTSEKEVLEVEMDAAERVKRLTGHYTSQHTILYIITNKLLWKFI